MPEADPPRPLLDRLGVRPGMRVALLDVDDPDIRPLLAARGADVTEGAVEPGTDMVLVGVDQAASLGILVDLEPLIRRDGAIWVLRPRGTAAIRETDVIAAARAAGLVDNKIARFSETRSGMRLVVPLARR